MRAYRTKTSKAASQTIVAETLVQTTTNKQEQLKPYYCVQGPQIYQLYLPLLSPNDLSIDGNISFIAPDPNALKLLTVGDVARGLGEFEPNMAFTTDVRCGLLGLRPHQLPNNGPIIKYKIFFIQ